jgi:Flp pilus assembly protein TadB
LSLWLGSTLVLSRVRWFARPSLVDRLRPYVPGGLAPSSFAGGGGVSGPGSGAFSAGSFREAVEPLAEALGDTLARLFGVRESAAQRLERTHSPLDVATFRLREVGRMAGALGAASLLVLVVQPPAVVALLFLVGGPLLAFLLLEQQLATASERRQRRLFLELPVVAEQLAMLLSAGYSLGSALARLGARGSGVAAEDLRVVVGRIRQGLSEVEALREWAALAGVPALDRLVPVLALNREAADLGRLVSEEARAIRRDVHRELVETMERRSQSVWIPVTVATLVPGVIFLAIPFIEALRLFAGA